ncbi:MAG: hypothetical protein A2133_09785 [Actinobacteria bacterium RBG_16_64_13]|nr:MAG: hypothetical protein A2133_09785 [Actinobacteria bacterium RBG_16_64_13]
MKDDHVYLDHILMAISRVEEYTSGGRELFLASPLHQDGTLRNLQTMAEATHHLTESLKARHPEIDWRAIAAFRNVLVHDYLGVDLEVVFGIATSDVARLKEAIQKLKNEGTT